MSRLYNRDGRIIEDATACDQARKAEALVRAELQLSTMIGDAVERANKLGLAGRRVRGIEVFGDRFHCELIAAPAVSASATFEAGEGI